MTQAFYAPQIFDVSSIQAAKEIILTPEGHATPDERWARETPYLCDLIGQHIKIEPNARVLDFGGGIGRISKPLIERHGCQATVVDISNQMRALGHIYVDSPNFFSVSRESLLSGSLFRQGFGLAIAIWSLQHVWDMAAELDLLNYVLEPEGKLFIVNERSRALPTNVGWYNDNKDIFDALEANFKTDILGELDPAIVNERLAQNAFWGVFSKK